MNEDTLLCGLALNLSALQVEVVAGTVGEMLEGCRQQVKVFDNFIDSRDIARIDINGKSCINDSLRAAIEVMRTAEKGTTTIDQIDTALAALGYTRNSLAQELGDVVRAIG